MIDGRHIRPIRMGAPEVETPTQIIKGIDVSSEAYKAGKIVVEEFRLDDVVAFEGSYSFPPIIL